MIDLSEVEEYAARGLLPRDLADKIAERAEKFLLDSIRRAERSSGVEYPQAVVKPYLMVIVYMDDVSYESNMYARTVVAPDEERGIAFRVEFTAPLVLYGSRDTIDAVVAHELTHYLLLLKRFSSYALTQEPIASVFESEAIDEEMTVEPSAVFRKRSRFLRVLREKFREGLEDKPFENRVERRWVKKGLPVVRINAEENIARIPVESILKLQVSDKLAKLLEKL